jgi:hypothetical protein
MEVLRQSTSQTIRLGPFVDDIDGVTPEIALTILNTDIKISKDGGAAANKNLGGAAVDGANGWYIATLDSIDTNTVGLLQIDIAMTGALPVWMRFQVIEEAIYDSLFAGGAISIAVEAKQDIIDANVDSILAQTGSTGVVIAAAQTVAVVTDITNQVSSNVTAVSGGSAAADNLEAMFDGTGYIHDTAPASRDQVANLSTGSAAISTVASSGSITTGENPIGDYTDTFTRDGIYNSVDEVNATGNMEIEYQFNVGGNGVAVNVVMFGRLSGNGDILAVQAWNWTLNAGAGGWEQIGTLINDSVDTEHQYNLNVGHTGTGANAGDVRIRGFEGAGGLSSVTLYLDQVYIAYSIVAQSVGYANGAIWVDTLHGVSGVEPYVNGTADNPVSLWSDALSLSVSLGIHRFQTSSGSEITLTANSDYYEIIGIGSKLHLGGQNCSGARFLGLIVDGICTGTNPYFKECQIDTATLPPCRWDRCGFTDVVTAGASGHFFNIDGFSQVAGANSPEFNFNSLGNINLCQRRFGGGTKYSGLLATDTISAEATVGGTLTINGTGGAVEMRGGWKALDDQSGGAVTVTRSKTHANMASIDNNESSATNLAASTQGIEATIVATSASATEFTLTDGSAIDDTYIGRSIIVTSDSGSHGGEAQEITDYIGATKTVTVKIGFTTLLTVGDKVVIV